MHQFFLIWPVCHNICRKLVFIQEYAWTSRIMSLSDHNEWNDTMGGDCYFSVITQQMVRRKVVPLPRTKLRLMSRQDIQYIPRNMHTVFALLCFVVVIHWLIVPYPSGLLHWHCGNLTIAPVPAKQPWWIWIYTSCEFIMNDCITTTKQSTTKPCAYFLGYTVNRSDYVATMVEDALVPNRHQANSNLILTMIIIPIVWHKYIVTAIWNGALIPMNIWSGFMISANV